MACCLLRVVRCTVAAVQRATVPAIGALPCRAQLLRHLEHRLPRNMPTDDALDAIDDGQDATDDGQDATHDAHDATDDAHNATDDGQDATACRAACNRRRTAHKTQRTARTIAAARAAAQRMRRTARRWPGRDLLERVVGRASAMLRLRRRLRWLCAGRLRRRAERDVETRRVVPACTKAHGGGCRHVTG